MLTELTNSEIDSVSGGNNGQIDQQVDNWMRNNPNRQGYHWQADYTYDTNWQITGVTVYEVQDAVFA
ncbi:hypothetical protein [Sphingorhabdus sp.]|uniref:hypothetical protein n=1 Tax=Sphingorhabdus sp. TaxID=1902408 RepID=UPI003919AEF6